MNSHIAFEAMLGESRPETEAAIAQLQANQIVERIWQRDHTVWRDDPTEISNRLGWLDIAERMLPEVQNLTQLVDQIRADGYTQALLLGMGGSSLTPELFARTFGPAEGYLTLAVLDSTDPDAVAARAAGLDPAKTLFIVSSKSGGTVEMISFFNYFYNWTMAAVGPEQAGSHFVAITDPGSKLGDLAQRYGFRAVLWGDPNIGGRYSALSPFGLFPAGLIGLDLVKLLERAIAAAHDPLAEWLGGVMGQMARSGRDKLTFILSPEIASFGDWVEQLIAESSGKEGKGILPVVGEVPAGAESYGPDRLFVYLRLAGGLNDDSPISALQAAGRPTITIHLNDLYDLGGQLMLWEMATAVAGHLLAIQPFDQPNVESAKKRATQMVNAYKTSGALPAETPLLSSGNLTIFGDVAPAGTIAETVAAFLSQARPGGYVAIQAYTQPTPESDEALAAFRQYVWQSTGRAVTVGYGPRFLHSTGQLHKGDGGNSLFIQITAADAHDLAIPDMAGLPQSSMTFGVLKMAQALGDAQALRDNGRPVIRLHLG